MPVRMLPIAAAATLLASLPALLHAQASFFEGFDGRSISELVNDGWILRNQSQPVGPLGWRPDDLTTPYAGTHYFATDTLCMGSGQNRRASNWAILPPIPQQIAGDEITLHLSEGWSLVRDDALELRYAPSGTSTGSGPDAVGSFTTLLATFEHDTLGNWEPRTFTLPGPGRIALRYVTPNGRGAAMYVDSITVGEPVGGLVPFPDPGETVHWTAALSPIHLDDGISNIAAGGHVIVDPGVTVQLTDGAALHVHGAITFQDGTTLHMDAGSTLQATGPEASAHFLGDAATPIDLRGSESFFTPALRIFSGARLTMQHVDASFFGWISSGSTAVLDHVTFTRTGAQPDDAPGLRVYHATLAFRNGSLTRSAIRNEDGYLLLDHLALDDSVIDDQRYESPQTIYLNHIDARNVADGAPFRIDGFDVFLGPDNLIADNLHPVRLQSGGLAPGSTVPAAGNDENVISGIARFGRRSTWANVGLPYVLDWDSDIPSGGGRITVEPGVTARFRRAQSASSDAFPIQFFADFVARGTPDQPITLRADDPDAGWGGLAFQDNDTERPRLHHTIIEDADTGAIASLCNIRLIDSLIRNCARGAQSNSFGQIIARGTTFMQNGVGVETSPGSGGVGINAGQADLRGLTNPNSFIDNGAGVRIFNAQITDVDARGNWWNSPTGPTHASNPGGSGDSADPTADVTPYLTSPPPADHPPLVRMMPLADILEEGSRVIIHWSVDEDHALVGQRLEYTPHGLNPPLSTLINNIPAEARSIEVVVPPSPPSSNTLNPVFRVVAIDDAGQEGWDEATFFTPWEDFTVSLAVDAPATMLRPGEHADICWDGPWGDAWLMLDDLHYAVSLGGTSTNCLSLGLTAPAVSTDLARIAVAHTSGAGGRVRYEYSDYFSIRPDSAIGDAPPTVTMLTPVQGAAYPGASVVPVTWTSADDEGLRSVEIQASYDGGRAWNVVARDLPGDATTWAWQLPSSEGIAEVRLRVVVRDLRFQASSDGADRTFSITPASGCTGDLDGSRAVDFDDLNMILANWNTPYTFDDLNTVLENWDRTCP